MKVDVDVIRPGTPSAADQSRRKALYFLIANIVSFAIAGGIFYLLAFGITEGRGFDRVMAKVQGFFSSHMGIAALAASTPFFASILVGQYEARRARARRKRKEAEDKRAEITAELETDRAARRARHAENGDFSTPP